MIYLDNTTQSQQVYIPRQIIQTATTREINVITSGDVINIVNEKLEPYYTSAQTDNAIDEAIATESARCEETYVKQGEFEQEISDIEDRLLDFVLEEDFDDTMTHYWTSAQTNTAINDAIAAESARSDSTYAKPSDIPDVSDFVTSAQVETQIIDKGYATEQWVEDKHYLTEHQSLSAYSTTEQVEGMIATESARCEETYAKISDIPDVSDFVSSAQVQTQIDNSISGIPTQFKTINNESIIGEGNIEIQGGGSYSAGTNIDITDNVISVTGITIPDVSNFVTSADVKTQIEDYHYITSASLPDVSDFVTSADVKTQVEEYNYVNSGQVKSQIEGYNYITAADLPDVSEFITSADAKTQIDEAIGAESARCEQTYAKPADIPDVSDFVTSAQVETQITDKHYVTSAETKTQIEDYHYITSASLPDVSDFVTSADVKTQVEEYNYVNSADVKTQIEDNLSAYTKTTDFATINGSGITSGGNLVIQGGGGSSYTAGDGIDITNDVISVTGRQETLVSGTNIKTVNNESLLGSGNITIQGGGSSNIELTQAEYSALTSYTQDALYIISDAEEVDLNDFATSGDVATISGVVQTLSGAVDNKADKVSVNSNSSYMRFPKWNSQGIITGYTYQSYQASFTVNGNSRTIYSTTDTAMPNVYAPTTVGTAGQPVLSNGSGAPVWAEFKFWYGTQAQYDAITTKDSSTIYFVKPD